jgi:phosphoribosylaminoimidazole carboxylase (NCAIR synthetase)
LHFLQGKDNKFFFGIMRVGIIGGGQLGYMLIKYGLRKLDPNVKITILDPAGDQCCCAQLAGVEIIQGDL